jgi:vancomycin permeability regulator SanA
MVILGVVAAGAVLGVVVVELSHYLAMRAMAASFPGGRPDRGEASEAVIVLGFPPRRDGQTNAIQRWRCRIAVRSLDPGRSSALIMTGAATNGPRSEAEVMAGYARDALGVPAEQIMLEERARSTWDNIQFSLPLAEQFTVIKIASDPFHVRRAHRYVARIRPDLVTRLEPAECYRPGEYLVVKAAIVAYEIWSRARRRGIALLSGG